MGTSKVQSAHAASDEDWAEAVRREAAIRPLIEAPRLGRLAVQAVAKELGLSVPRIYSLIRTFRTRPVTASMLPLGGDPRIADQTAWCGGFASCCPYDEVGPPGTAFYKSTRCPQMFVWRGAQESEPVMMA